MPNLLSTDIYPHMDIGEPQLLVTQKQN